MCPFVQGNDDINITDEKDTVHHFDNSNPPFFDKGRWECSKTRVRATAVSSQFLSTPAHAKELKNQNKQTNKQTKQITKRGMSIWKKKGLGRAFYIGDFSF